MAGLFLDIYIAFAVRWMILIWRDTVSRKWPQITGTIVRCHLEKPGFGCMYVVLRYKYKKNSERYEGEIREPFTDVKNARALVQHHQGGGELTICVSPTDATLSFPIVNF